MTSRKPAEYTGTAFSIAHDREVFLSIYSFKLFLSDVVVVPLASLLRASPIVFDFGKSSDNLIHFFGTSFPDSSSQIGCKITTASFGLEILFKNVADLASFLNSLKSWRVFEAQIEADLALSRLKLLSENADVAEESILVSASPDSHALSARSVYDIRGKQLFIQEKVSEGFYGEVFKGEFCGSKVAIKKFKLSSIASSEEVARTKASEMLESAQEEISVMYSLRHPNVVLFMGASFDFSLNANNMVSFSPLIVMEFMEHGSLYSVLHDRNRLTDQKISEFIHDICAGMQYLHSKSIIHFDLKPLNLLLDKNDTVKISDFGVSVVLRDVMLDAGDSLYQDPEHRVRKKIARAPLSTVLYMPYESIFGKGCVDASVDVFSFGMVVYEMLYVNEHPDTDFCIDDNIGYELVREPLYAGLDPMFPPWWPVQLRSILRDCLSNNPDDRPEFSELIDRFSLCFSMLKDSCSGSHFFLHRLASRSIASLTEEKGNGFFVEYAVFKPFEYISRLLEIKKDMHVLFWAFSSVVNITASSSSQFSSYKEALPTSPVTPSQRYSIRRQSRLVPTVAEQQSPTNSEKNTSGLSLLYKKCLDCLADVLQFELPSILTVFDDSKRCFFLSPDFDCSPDFLFILTTRVLLNRQLLMSLKDFDSVYRFMDTILKFLTLPPHSIPVDLLVERLEFCDCVFQALGTAYASHCEPFLPFLCQCYEYSQRMGTNDDKFRRVSNRSLQILCDISVLDSYLASEIEDRGIFPLQQRMVSRKEVVRLLESDSRCVRPQGFMSIASESDLSSSKKSRIGRTMSKTMKLHRVQSQLGTLVVGSDGKSAQNIHSFGHLSDIVSRSRPSSGIVSDEDILEVLGYVLMHRSDPSASALSESNAIASQILDESVHLVNAWLDEVRKDVEMRIRSMSPLLSYPIRVAPHTYVGSEWFASDFSALQSLGIRIVVHCEDLSRDLFPNAFNYFRIQKIKEYQNAADLTTDAASVLNQLTELAKDIKSQHQRSSPIFFAFRKYPWLACFASMIWNDRNLDEAALSELRKLGVAKEVAEAWLSRTSHT
eukprot:ANDGO_02983.mRNA.1 Dual specificity protein kinase pyk3